MASRESKGRELSSEWSHHRISSIDSKVRVTLRNPLKHSGSERVSAKFELRFESLKSKFSLILSVNRLMIGYSYK